MQPIPEQMTAIVIEGGKGPASALKPATRPTPQPGPGQVLIRVQYAGVNRPDVMQRKGIYPPPAGAPDTLGLEVSGTIATLGEGAQRWAVGDSVCALLGGGGYADYCVADARHCLAVPRGLDMRAAAALPETMFTVFANVFELGRLQAGETFMVHGATSGIGVTAIQLAKAAGARVIATGRGAGKAEAARRLGADLAVDSSAEDFAAVAEQDGGADVILDMVGGDYTMKNLKSLKAGGRLVQIATQAGNLAQIDLALIMRKRLTLAGSTLRARPADEKARLARAVEAAVWPWLESGRVRVEIAKIFPLADAAGAHAYLEGGTHLGKVVLKVAEP